MKITITKGKDNEKVKEFEIPTDRIIRGFTKLGVFSFMGREVMRVRPPRRNVGVIFNYMTAAAITDAIMALADGTIFKKNEPEVVAECESFEEVMDEKKEDKNESGNGDEEKVSS